MPLKEFRREDSVPSYVRAITDSDNPEFSTCEILRKIDNLMSSGKHSACKEKIRMLKSLKRGLEASLDIPFRISDSQHDRNGVIFTLIDEKIRDYSLIWKSLPPEPKIYDRR